MSVCHLISARPCSEVDTDVTDFDRNLCLQTRSPPKAKILSSTLSTDTIYIFLPSGVAEACPDHMAGVAGARQGGAQLLDAGVNAR